MYKPDDVFGVRGMPEYNARLFQLKESLFFFTNNADDLHMGSDDRSDKILHLMNKLSHEISLDDFMLTGDGETDQDA